MNALDDFAFPVDASLCTSASAVFPCAFAAFSSRFCRLRSSSRARFSCFFRSFSTALAFLDASFASLCFAHLSLLSSQFSIASVRARWACVTSWLSRSSTSDGSPCATPCSSRC
jgi:hypothetical protein